MAEIGLKCRKLKSPSTTRWVEQVSTLDGFVEAFEAIYRSLRYMKENLKILERCVFNQLYNFLNENSLLSKHQFGFCPNILLKLR